LALAALALVPFGRAVAQAPASKATPEPAAIDPRAEKAMRDMSAFLAGARRFALEAEETFDLEIARAYRVQLSNVRKLTVERPSRFAADATGDTLHRSSWFDGRTLTVLNKQENLYASLEAPGTIDTILDKIAADFQVVLPLSDLLYSDPYATLMEGVLYGRYLGIHDAAGMRCHHLTFGQEGVYWQIWIDEGDQPWPRRLSIAYWEDSGVPRYEATFRRWVLDPPQGEEQFRFKPPAGARRIELAELARTWASAAADSTP
jgi:hypothetical protein